MLRALTDTLYSKNAAVNWLKKKHPEEDIVFASAATILETNKATPTAWSFHRLFQRRGVLILTRNLLVLKDNFFSLFTIFWLVIFVSSLIMLFRYPGLNALVLLGLSGVFILQRLPYQQKIPLSDIQNAELNSVQGISTKGSLLTVSWRGKTINIVPAQLLDEELIRMISSPSLDTEF